MAKKSKEPGHKVRRKKASKKIGKSPPSTFDRWLGLQVVKPAKPRPEVRVPPGTYEEWIRGRVRKKKLGLEGRDA